VNRQKNGIVHATPNRSIESPMDVLLYRFPVSGVETWVWLPPLVMFLISSFVSMGGVSGAFVLIPFQVSCLGYTAPGVTATNFVYNVVAIPVGVGHYIRERRISWSVFGVLMIGTLPGVFLGYVLRVTYLPDPAHFVPFVGLVLAFLGGRTLWSVVVDLRKAGRPEVRVSENEKGTGRNAGRITGGRIGPRRTTVIYSGKEYAFRTAPVFVLSGLVGIVGGAYGIGGGVIMAPFLVSVLNLPVPAVAGAALSSTWFTSVVAVAVYALAPGKAGMNASPDWLLGGLFGLGGMAGIYVGARLQRVVPSVVIKSILGFVLTAVAIRYLWPVF